jgi:hypothetical protein
MNSLSLFQSINRAAVHVQAVLGVVGGTVSVEDSENGTTLILLITNPSGPRVRITGCIGERKSGWRGRRRERFRIPMHGIPHDFAQDEDGCMAWIETAALPPMDGVSGLFAVDSEGNHWPVDDEEHLALIVDRLTRRRAVGRTRSATA